MAQTVKKAILGAALAVVGLGLPAMAGTTENYQFRGKSASAYFYQYDECNSTSVSVWASEMVSKSAPGAPTDQTEAFVSYGTWNWCTGQYSYGYGSGTNVTFQPGNSLSGASLTGTFTLYDYPTGSSKTASVNLTWTGTGTTNRENSHYTSHWMGGISKYRYNGSYRTADVSGSVTVDGKNVTSGLTSEGYLNSSNSGSMQLYRR